MRTRTRKIAVTASGMALSFAALAGCGDNTDGPKAATTHPPTTAAPAATTRAAPLTQAELWNAVISEKDLTGFRVGYVQLKGSAYQPGTPPNRLPAVFPAACTPVYWSTQAGSTYPATAHIDAMATQHSPSQFGQVTLVVYSATDAPKVMADLHTALSACADAHIERHDPLGSDTSYTHPETQPTAHLGDDALSFTITQTIVDGDTDPIAVTMAFTVVRVGTTIATFTNHRTTDRTIPVIMAPRLIPAQVAKLTQSPHKPA